MDLALDIVTGDLALEEGDAFLVEEEPAVRQRLMCRCQMLKGEDVLDTNNGVPLFDVLGEKNAEKRLERIYRRLVQTSEGVDSILEWNYQFDHATREATLAFVVQMVSGLIVPVPAFALAEF